MNCFKGIPCPHSSHPAFTPSPLAHKGRRKGVPVPFLRPHQTPRMLSGSYISTRGPMSICTTFFMYLNVPLC